ncbi:gamma-glutamyltransferase family protein [Lentisalinibacter salinarum]|uniref:gamma-glutamyltransferase family protein n=1 Tax=Lentisalinibacter salinarum TaxID=2992239 RepID=UPI0038695462
MSEVAVATTSPLAAEAALAVIEDGGNAVDAAVAASMASTNTQPGVCALAGGGYAVVWPPDGDPVTIDGYVEMPGRGLAADAPGRGGIRVAMDYGGGLETVIGPGSVAVPGTPAALAEASRRYGRLPWAALLEPSIRAARAGFPLASACHHYLEYSGDVVFSRSPDSRAAIHDDDGRLLAPGDTVHVPHLADSLELIARDGVRAFYEGELAQAIVQHVRAGEGALTLADMAAYRPILRPALTIRTGGWDIATNPPPAIGGAVLGAMLEQLDHETLDDWTEKTVARLIAAMHGALTWRRERLDLAEDPAGEGEALLAAARRGELGRLPALRESGSTVHTSAVDAQGLACAITVSSGYGSGEMPPGTGLWLNNCLGEIELNRRGLVCGPAGTRLPSNMAPTTARSDGRVLAIGTPGAGRITTALCQVLVNFFRLGLGLDAAVAHPRLHVEIRDDGDRVACEPGLPMPDVGLPVRTFDGLSMYFGGVGAVLHDERRGFEIAADPRRAGGVCLGRASPLATPPATDSGPAAGDAAE